MKSLKLFLMTIIILLSSTHSFAAPKEVSLTWTMTNTDLVIGYNVYYSDKQTMADKVWHTDCSDVIEGTANMYTITCNNLNMEDGEKYYFIIAAKLSNNTEMMSEYEIITYMSPVKNFRVIDPQ